jgi:hypothetical protein
MRVSSLFAPPVVNPGIKDVCGAGDLRAKGEDRRARQGLSQSAKLFRAPGLHQGQCRSRRFATPFGASGRRLLQMIAWADGGHDDSQSRLTSSDAFGNLMLQRKERAWVGAKSGERAVLLTTFTRAAQ